MINGLSPILPAQGENSMKDEKPEKSPQKRDSSPRAIEAGFADISAEVTLAAMERLKRKEKSE
jgi:hypothetical protein